MLIDKFNRRIDYLRISVTDRCNLRCIYCMPECGIIHKPQEELLTFEEITKIVKVGVDLGIDKIRITGGEPLVRKDLVYLVTLLNKIDGIKDISLTTNGILLKKYAFELKKAGLKRINLSLDSLKKSRYNFITRGGDWEDVWQGLSEAIRIGFSPLKINVLLLDETSIDEIMDFVRLTWENPICVRFLEFMPVNSFYKQKEKIFSSLVLEKLKGIENLEEIKILGEGPAQTFKFKNAMGSFGIISPMSNKFCFTCNRLRLTSDGFLRLCLHSDLKINLREALRTGASEEKLKALIKQAVSIKPKEHNLGKDEVMKLEEFSMCQIGG